MPTTTPIQPVQEDNSAQEMQRRDQILGAALRVFGRDGYHKASIKNIAKEAGLKSQALIYWYFKDKQELFQEVILSNAPMLNILGKLESLMDEEPSLVLPVLARGYLCLVDNDQGKQLVRLFFLEVSRHPELGEALATQGFERMKVFMTAYLKRQIDLGRLKPHDEKSSSAAFIGTLMIYLINHSLLPSMAQDFPPKEDYIRQCVQVFLHGVGAPV